MSEVADCLLIVFSKDRPFQLKEYLRSFRNEIVAHSNASFRIIVIYTFTPNSLDTFNDIGSSLDIEQLYLRVAESFGAHHTLMPAFSLTQPEPENASISTFDPYGSGKWRVEFVRESREKPTANILFDLFGFSLGSGDDLSIIEAKPREKFVLWGVDDALWIQNFDLSQAMALLEQNLDVWTFHLRLHPGLDFCHTTDTLMQRPGCCAQFHPVSTNESNGEHSLVSFFPFPQECDASSERASLLVFPIGKTQYVQEKHKAGAECHSGTLDWNYPWDLCSSLYRMEDVLHVLQGLAKMPSNSSLPFHWLSHPNRIEFGGLQYVQSTMHCFTMVKESASSAPYQRRYFAACPSSPIVLVVTVNRVQDLFHTPVFLTMHNKGEQNGLNTLLEEKVCMDQTKYLLATLRGRLRSVHVGPLWTTTENEQSTIMKQNTVVSLQLPVSQPLVSVIIPVRNAEAWVEAAVRSIMQQTMTAIEIIIIVDIGNIDQSPKIVDELQKQDSRIRVIHREEFEQESVQGNETKASIGHQNGRGLSVCLNMGIAHARAEYIARMDADDVAELDRLESQIAVLTEQPNLFVVGSAVELFTENESGQQESKEMHPGSEINQEIPRGKPVFHPSSSALIQWSMFFYCSITHPTALFRRDNWPIEVFSDSRVSYSEEEDAEYVEDYDLWLRCIGKVSMANVPDMLLHLRKHGENVSTIHRSTQQRNFIRVLTKSISSIVSCDVDESVVQALLRPTPSVHTAHIMLSAAHVLLQLEAWMLGTESAQKTHVIEVTPSEEQKIRQDVTNRITELALLSSRADVGIAIDATSRDPSFTLWAMCIRRNPTKQLRQLLNS